MGLNLNIQNQKFSKSFGFSLVGPESSFKNPKLFGIQQKVHTDKNFHVKSLLS
jgi:hypothetical protein